MKIDLTEARVQVSDFVIIISILRDYHKRYKTCQESKFHHTILEKELREIESPFGVITKWRAGNEDGQWRKYTKCAM